MATVKAVIFKHHKKEDGTYNVKIRITHNRSYAYLPSPFFVSKNELNRKFEIIDNAIMASVDSHVTKLRKAIIELGAKVELHTVKSLAEHLKNSINQSDNKQLDFISFMTTYVNELKENNKSIYRNYYPALVRIKSFSGDCVPFESITPAFLERFEKHLYESGAGKRGVPLYMSCYRKIFNEAKKRLNDEDRGIVVVKNYPFSKYKVPAIPESKPRAAGIDIVLQLYNYIPKRAQDELAKDLFFLSFYLVGINAIDLYKLKQSKDGRITYNRSKTKEMRADNAEISILIEPEALSLLEKYKDETGERLLNLYKRYKSVRNLGCALSDGFIEIRNELNIDNLTFYSARHSWATIASHNCDISEDKIARCLNHVSMNYRVTSRYIKKDWSVIDRANRAVIDFVIATLPADNLDFS